MGSRHNKSIYIDTVYLNSSINNSLQSLTQSTSTRKNKGDYYISNKIDYYKYLKNRHTQGYFELINIQRARYFNFIKNHKTNYQIAVQKKHFNKSMTVRSLRMLPKSANKDTWRVRINHYIDKQIKEGIMWYTTIKQQFNTEPFEYENYFQSACFFESLSNIIKPKAIENGMKEIEKKQKDMEVCRNSISNLYNNPNYDPEQLNNLYNTVDNINTFTSIEDVRNTINQMNLNNNTMGRKNSLNAMSEVNEFDNLTFYLENEEEVNSRYEQFKAERKDVKDIAKIFKRGLKDERHPINIFIKMVEEKFSLLIIQKTKQLEEENQYGKGTMDLIVNAVRKESNLEEEIKELIKHIQLFIIEMQTALKLFYIDSVDLQCFVEEKDETINIITSQLFRTGNFYINIKNLFAAQLEAQIKQFGIKLKQLKGISQKEIGIKDKFSLDYDTIKLQNQIIEEYQRKEELLEKNDTTSSVKFTGVGVASYFDKVEPDDLRQSGITCKNEANNTNPNIVNINLTISKPKKKIKDKHQVSLIRKSLTGENKLKSKLSLGYTPAVKLLSSVKNVILPYKKMLKISMVSEEITKCVNHFWEEAKPFIPKEDYLTITADDLMVLFIYILIKSEMSDILVEERIIENFTSKMTRGSSIGYYFTTLQAAIDYITNEKITDDKMIRSNFLEKRSMMNSFIEEDEMVFD